MRNWVLIVFLGAAAAAGQAQTASNPRNGSLTSIFGNQLALTLAAQDTVNVSNTYYFPHMAFGGGWQTTLTYVNYSPQVVNCNTTFRGNDGSLVSPPFSAPIPTQLAPGASFHIETQAAGGEIDAWAQAGCDGPIKPSLLYRLYNGATAVGEAGVNATATPTTEFVTYAQSLTGIALANPQVQPANVTVNVLNSAGSLIFTTSFVLNPSAHFSNLISGLSGAPANFTGSVQILSPGVPIVALSLNAEKFPSFSSLPPGDLPDGTPLATGH
jgi:hypothetical protein